MWTQNSGFLIHKRPVAKATRTRGKRVTNNSLFFNNIIEVVNFNSHSDLRVVLPCE